MAKDADQDQDPIWLSLMSVQPHKYFVQTSVSLVPIFLISGAFAFGFYFLADISPRPTSNQEVEAIYGFNLDLSLPPGYTIGQLHSADIIQVAVLSLVLATLFTAVFAVIQKYFEGAFLNYRLLMPIILCLIFATILLTVLEFGSSYYPKPAIRYNESLAHNQSLRYKESFGIIRSRGEGFWSRSANDPFRIIVAVESLLIGAITAVYTQELVPTKQVEESEYGKYLELHSSLWWNYTQVVLSMGIAVAVGLGVPVMLEVTIFGRLGILSLILILFAALGGLLAFSLFKLHCIGRFLENERLL